MKKKQADTKKEWHKPAFESLKFSQTLGGDKPKWAESVTHGPHSGGSSAS